ncbi:MAG: PQQ-binding-like beta-propeller repeat protein [Rhodobacteraceae bacterium]|nr:PQQ-binding-like beta-propeller repeat protein [Paracoccaceae bacterium]
MPNAFLPLRIRGLALLPGICVCLLSCTEPEVILVGDREPIRPETETAGTLQEGSRTIRLPAMSSNATWSQSFGTEAYRVAHPALRNMPQLIWSANIGNGDERRRRITAGPVVGDGRVYTLDSTARVSAVSPAGAVLWTIDLLPPYADEKDATGGGIAFDDGALYISLGFGDMVKLDATSGAEIWRQKLGATGSGTPTVRDGLVYLVAGDETGWAVNKESGRIAWRIDAVSSVANVLGAPAPALTGQLAIFAFGSGDVVATFRQGGLRRWSASVSGRRNGVSVSRFSDVTGGPVVVGDAIYVGNQSGRIVSLNVDNGARNWTLNQGTVGMIWPAGDSLFAISDLNELMRIDASDGGLIWATDLPGFVKDRPRRRGEIFAHYGPVLAGDRVFVLSNDGLMRVFDPENGTKVAQVTIPDGASSAPAVANGTLYVVSGKGELHAFR